MTTFLVLLLVFLQFGACSAYKSLLGGGFESSFFDINIDRSHPEKLYKEFEDFIVKYKRTYKDEIEKKFRFNLFVNTHNTINQLSKKASAAGSGVKYGINKFADLTSEEYRIRFSKVAPGNHSTVPIFNLNDPKIKSNRTKRQLDNFPTSYDLRNVKVGGRYVMGPVKDQGHCGCCWAFAATAVAESALAVHQKKFISLSDQEVCDCGAKTMPGCAGGDPMLGLQYLEESGVTAEEEYEYEDGRSNYTDCDAAKHDRELNQFELSSYRIDPFNAEYQILQHLNILKLPVAAAFRVGKDFRVYESGVIPQEGCNAEEHVSWHSAAIVGYGVDLEPNGKAQDFWVVKNSWGASGWGNEGGFVRVPRGTNWCDIESHVTGARIPE